MIYGTYITSFYSKYDVGVSFLLLDFISVFLFVQFLKQYSTTVVNSQIYSFLLIRITQP